MIYGLADLHLDHTNEKSMEIFGPRWNDYQNRIFENWESQVTEADLVLVPGDISWGLRLEDAKPDLERINNLPGKKILLRGNHDYWWQSLNKLNGLGLDTLFFLQNNSYYFKGVNIAGTRGWIPRDASELGENHETIFKRELIRLDLSLKSIDNTDEIIAMLHYPPFERDGQPNEFHDILKHYRVIKCVYGHLHSEGLSAVVEGVFDGIDYRCLSADYIDFTPKIIY